MSWWHDRCLVAWSMAKLSRLELACLVITLAVVAGTAIVLLGRQQKLAQAEDDDAVAGDLQQMERVDPARLSEPDQDPADPQVETDIQERVRSIPRPDSVRPLPSSDIRPVAGTGVTSNIVVKPVPPPQGVSTNDIVADLERVAAMPWGATSEQLLGETVSRWARTDPSAALDYALGIESRRVRNTLINGVFSSWAKTDPNGAFSWLLANRESSPDTFQLGLKPVFSVVAGKSVPDAMRMAMDLGGTDRMAAIGVVMGQASSSGVMPSMVSYMDSFQTDGERRRYASLLSQNWAVYAPEQAAAWALSLSDPALKGSAMASVVSTWAADSPNAAVNWVMALPEGELRNQQMAQVTKSWARYDPVKAADWILSLRPPATSLDPAVRSLVRTIMTSNPDAAAMWATTIADSKLRNRMIMNVAREWMKADPKKASAYVATAPLTPAQRRELLKTRR